MNPFIFVYGTLCLGNDNPVARFFHQNSNLVGAGSLPGKKLDLGDYPGLLFNPDAETFVIGEIFKMNRPAMVLKVLDEYEGIGPGFPEPHEYVRKLCPVKMDAATISCWVYLYQWPYGEAFTIS